MRILTFLIWLLIGLVGLVFFVLLLPLILVILLIGIIVNMFRPIPVSQWRVRFSNGARMANDAVHSGVNRASNAKRPESVVQKPGARKTTVVDADAKDL